MATKKDVAATLRYLKYVLDNMLELQVTQAQAEYARQSLSTTVFDAFITAQKHITQHPQIDEVLNYAEINRHIWSHLESQRRRNILQEAEEELKIMTETLLGKSQAYRESIAEFDPVNSDEDQMPTCCVGDGTINTSQVQTDCGTVSDSAVHLPQGHAYQTLGQPGEIQTITCMTATLLRSPQTRDSANFENGSSCSKKTNVDVNTDRILAECPSNAVTQEKQEKRACRMNSKRRETHEQIIQDKDKQIQDLASRLSQMAGQRLRECNPNITDLSDGNRPTRLAERFSELYDNEWSDAYEELINKGIQTEHDVLHLLTQVLKHGLEFCKFVAETQLKGLRDTLVREMLRAQDQQPIEDEELGQQVEDHLGCFRTAEANLKQAQRVTAAVSLPGLKKAFRTALTNDWVARGYIYLVESNEFGKYIENCIELLWLMTLQDPPLHLKFCYAGEKCSDYFREYTKSGTVVVECAWPALFLHQDGPLMTRGVASLE